MMSVLLVKISQILPYAVIWLNFHLNDNINTP